MEPLIVILASVAAPWALVAAELALITVMGRAMNQLFLRAFGQRLYLLLMWPGIAVHELSHAAACVLTRTRVREIHLFAPQPGGRGELVLGYVVHDLPRERWKRVVIGAAPFFGGGAVMVLLAAVALPESFHAAVSTAGRLPDLASLVEAFRAAVLEAARPELWLSGWAWIAAWMLFVVGAHVSPSRSDLADAAAAFAVLAAVVVPLVAFLAWAWPEGFSSVFGALSRMAFALAAAVGLAVTYIALAFAGILVVTAPVFLFRWRSGRRG